MFASAEDTVAAYHSSILTLTPKVTPRRIALIGNFAPRKCGIAAFTTDIQQQLRRHQPEVAIDVWALDDADHALTYDGIAGRIERSDPRAYRAAAEAINAAGVDAVWLQHEYGIFGGPDGEMVCDFVDRLAAPLILTCHTVLSDPSPEQRAILDHLLARATRVMLMSHHSKAILERLYSTPPHLIDIVEHGAPDRPFGRQAEYKRKLDLAGRKVLTTFGLLGPGKGLEFVIEALPAIRARHPEVLYRIVGATHPNLVAYEGERYRDQLKVLADRLGVGEAIVWEDRFLETDELLDQLEACDIYLTPYPGLQQSTSGTLSYAVALGKAIVSTPYIHARELLAGGVGRLIEPGSADAIAQAVTGLLDDSAERGEMQRRAYTRGREMIWPRFAAAAAALVERAVARPARRPRVESIPSFHAVRAMSDATGMLQHSVGIVPDRKHGYCLDDNARALMLMNLAEGISPDERLERSMVYAAFVESAWNADAQAFRNFMRFDRSWCEDTGSDDSNGRAVWALGSTAADSPLPDIRQWAMWLFEKALPALVGLEAPRAVAFTMLGAAAVLRANPGHEGARSLLERGADLLDRLLASARRPDWAWFEAVLGYDNPRLPQALIEAGDALGRDDFRATGLETLEWIAGIQTAASGHFRPIGCETFGREYAHLPFDQQPLEAQAAIEACASAHRATGDERWVSHAQTAWRWFFGGNDRGAILADLATGRCRDGVTPRGANLNCGAESILAFQLGQYSMLAMARSVADDSARDGLEKQPREALRPLAYS